MICGSKRYTGFILVALFFCFMVIGISLLIIYTPRKIADETNETYRKMFSAGLSILLISFIIMIALIIFYFNLLKTCICGTLQCKT
jgi:4-hydroxybenzoate polyprenyltransferase